MSTQVSMMPRFEGCWELNFGARDLVLAALANRHDIKLSNFWWKNGLKMGQRRL